MRATVLSLIVVNMAAGFSPASPPPSIISRVLETSSTCTRDVNTLTLLVRSRQQPGQIQSFQHWPQLVPSTLRSSSDSESDASLEEEIPEEVLLRMNLSMNAGADPDAAIEAVRAYVRSFPFAAVLPVQPLQYLPTEDGNGVNVKFLRKKTKEKGSIDGGVDFSIEFSSPDDDEAEVGLVPLGRRIRLLATRNSKGQTVNKIFSEKIIVTEFVKGISGEDAGRSDETLSTLVSVDSVFHKWMG